MVQNEFVELCGRYLIEPAIALENSKVVTTLLLSRDTKNDTAKRGYRNHLIVILETEF